MSLLNPFPHAFGLDITNYRMRFVDIERKRNFSGKSYSSLRSFNQIDIPEGLVRDGEIKDEKKLSDLIKSMLATAIPRKTATKFVVASLPEPKTFIKVINIPWMEETEVPQAVKWEIEKHLPFSIEEVTLDYKILASDQKENKITILVGAAEQKIIQSYHRTLKLAGLIPLAIEVEAIAIARDLLTETDLEKPSLIIDIGRSRTNLILTAQGSVQFTTSLKFSGENIVQNIMDELAVTREEAMRLRDLCGVDPRRCKGEVRKIIFNSFDNLFKHTNITLQFYQDHINASSLPEKILLTGSSSMIAGLESIITDKTKIPSEIVNPSAKIKPIRNGQINEKFINILPGLSTAIGLALRGAASDVHEE